MKSEQASILGKLRRHFSNPRILLSKDPASRSYLDYGHTNPISFPYRNHTPPLPGQSRPHSGPAT